MISGTILIGTTDKKVKALSRKEKGLFILFYLVATRLL